LRGCGEQQDAHAANEELHHRVLGSARCRVLYR
jgi:hypothetical protein